MGSLQKCRLLNTLCVLVHFTVEARNDYHIVTAELFYQGQYVTDGNNFTNMIILSDSKQLIRLF
jgi:hypothetical protein